MILLETTPSYLGLKKRKRPQDDLLQPCVFSFPSAVKQNRHRRLVCPLTLPQSALAEQRGFPFHLHLHSKCSARTAAHSQMSLQSSFRPHDKIRKMHRSKACINSPTAVVTFQLILPPPRFFACSCWKQRPLCERPFRLAKCVLPLSSIAGATTGLGVESSAKSLALLLPKQPPTLLDRMRLARLQSLFG